MCPSCLPEYYLKVGHVVQGGQYGESTLNVSFPDGWFLDESGNSIRRTQIAPTDIAAAAVGLSVATLQLLHPHWTLNNLLACLIATDILQVLAFVAPCGSSRVA